MIAFASDLEVSPIRNVSFRLLQSYYFDESLMLVPSANNSSRTFSESKMLLIEEARFAIPVWNDSLQYAQRASALHAFSPPPEPVCVGG